MKLGEAIIGMGNFQGFSLICITGVIISFRVMETRQFFLRRTKNFVHPKLSHPRTLHYPLHFAQVLSLPISKINKGCGSLADFHHTALHKNMPCATPPPKTIENKHKSNEKTLAKGDPSSWLRLKLALG